MLSRFSTSFRQLLPGARAIATSQSALLEVTSNTKQFTEEFTKVAPANFNPPAYPSDYLEEDAPKEETQGVPSKVTLNFYMPHDTHMKSEEVGPCKIPPF